MYHNIENFMITLDPGKFHFYNDYLYMLILYLYCQVISDSLSESLGINCRYLLVKIVR